jgi:hypothetical protein
MRRRHLRPVDPHGEVQVELVRPGLPTEADARDVHQRVAAELRELTDHGLIQRARHIAEEFKAPARHKGLTHAEWCCLMVRMVGDVADEVAGTTLVGGPRPARQGRAAIERAVGLLLVLDDGLAMFQDDDQGA